LENSPQLRGYLSILILSIKLYSDNLGIKLYSDNLGIKLYSDNLGIKLYSDNYTHLTLLSEYVFLLYSSNPLE